MKAKGQKQSHGSAPPLSSTVETNKWKEVKKGIRIMERLSEELVEETWQEFASFTPTQVSKEAKKVAKGQPDLLSFMVEFTEELDQEVKELAIYMFFVVNRIFVKGYRKKIKKASPEEIIECYEQNEKLMESLEGAHDRFYERVASVQVSAQPYVIKYVVETLFEVPEEEDPIFISDEDVGFLFLLLKTAIDVLNKKTEN
jgi:hypothetical protein